MEKGALNGIKVVDLSRVIAGPHCSMILGDFGADVIKVEKKDSGDISRIYGPFHEGVSTYFMSQNRNKRGISLDFRHPGANDVLLKLLADADVLVENFKAGTLEAMGLAPEKLLELNPRLVITRISGFGQDGPYVNRVCYDPCGQAISGLMSLNGEPDRDPVMIGMYVCDFATGVYGALGTLAALQARQRTGRGQVVDVALLDVASSLTHNAIYNYYQLGQVMGRTGNQDRASWPANFYKSKDGRQMYMHAGNNDTFARFCVMSGNPEVKDDEEFKDLTRRRNHVAEVDKMAADWMAAHTSEEILAACEAYQIPCARVNTMDEAAHDPQLLYRGVVREMDDPEFGKVMMNGPAVKMSDTCPDVYRVAPRLGQHNREVLKEVLAYTDEEIDKMEADGLI